MRPVNDPFSLPVASWNLAHRRNRIEHFSRLLAAAVGSGPCLLLLQEVHPELLRPLSRSLGVDWSHHVTEVMTDAQRAERVRGRGVAIAGRGVDLDALHGWPGPGLAEKVLIADVIADGQRMTTASYHAPAGVTHHQVKPRQAAAFARWLADQTGPVLFGADTNTPEIDHPDFAQTRTHWHTGHRKLDPGELGEDALTGPARIHHLDDCLRLWLTEHPDELARITAERPTGPLAVSHRTGKRRDNPGTPRRFDSIWVSSDFVVTDVSYDYQGAVDAGSDHGLVVARLAWR